MSKILLREHHLRVGLVWKCQNRFYPHKEWWIYRLESLDLEKDHAQISVLAWKGLYGIDYTKYHPTKGTTTMFTHPSVHIYHKNTTWIDYYLPGGDVLYGIHK